MAVLAIGDLQGCYREFRRLLRDMNFRDDCDQLWLTGDLVNRGRQSLDALRYVSAMGASCVTVLGNHDLHVLALASGRAGNARLDEGLRELLRARDLDSLMDWLRQQPLMHHDPGLGYTLVHAGLSPQWTLEVALRETARVQKALRGDKFPKLMARMYGNEPDSWNEDLGKAERRRYAINACTRMRYCHPDGRLEFSQKGPPLEHTGPLKAWFEVPRPHQGLRIVFGHWSALGLVLRDDLIGLDTGCVWGRSLTGVRLEPEGVAQTWGVPCTGASHR